MKLSVFGNWNKTCAISECSSTSITCTTSGELIENRQSIYLNNLAYLIVEQYEVAAECVDDCSYQHSSSSPILNSIDNASPDIGDTITLTGTNLGAIESVLLMSGASKEVVETPYATRSAT